MDRTAAITSFLRSNSVCRRASIRATRAAHSAKALSSLFVVATQLLPSLFHRYGLPIGHSGILISSAKLIGSN